MIVDSKVSLTAYERYVNEENEELKPQFLKEHLNSLKRHVEQLSEKIIMICIKWKVLILFCFCTY
jgi:DNA recombination protein RmuC